MRKFELEIIDKLFPLFDFNEYVFLEMTPQ